MAHDNAAEYEDDLARRTAAELMTQDLRRGFRNKFDESLVNVSDKRLKVKRAARNAQRYHREHRKTVLAVEAIFVFLTLGGFRMFRRSRRNKS